MAVKGKGARFWLYNTTTSALVRITEVLSLTPPSPTRDTIDTTTHDSVGDYREFISSLIDAGEASLTIHYIPGSTGDLLLLAAMAAGDLRAFAVDVNSATGVQQRISGSCIMTAYTPADVVIDDKMTATVTVKVSGPLIQSATPVS